MTYQHTLPERAPRELLRRLVLARMKIMALTIHNIGIAIKHAREIT
jgi:hypothetical protein